MRSEGFGAPGLARQARWAAEVIALLATIPVFYLALLSQWHVVVVASYAVAAAVCAAALRASPDRAVHPPSQRLLVIALATAALVPAGESVVLVVARLGAALLAVWRVGSLVWPRLLRGGLLHGLLLACAVLALCGLGFWWLEPNAHGFGDGLWLAFTTAATVGYGDIVPTTPAAKIFAIFVVLLGMAALSLVTAAIAAMWVGSEERRIEREILADLHRQLKRISDDLEALAARSTRP